MRTITIKSIISIYKAEDYSTVTYFVYPSMMKNSLTKSIADTHQTQTLVRHLEPNSLHSN